jgi:hypothetical protein
MALKIAILEDNLDRQAIMRRCLTDRFYTFDARFFDNAPEMIRFLGSSLNDCIAIALDNDLEMIERSDGTLSDPGSGREVAEFLASREPVCPVIIHTTNTDAAAYSTELLKQAGWTTRRVIPFDDMNWIESDWFFSMRRAIVGPIKKQPSGSAA